MIDIDGRISYSAVEKLNKSSMTGMSVYPNPVFDIVQIAVSKISTIIITDQTGKIIVRKTLNAGTNSLNLAHLQVGVYYIKNTQTEEVIKFEKK
jgi:hypothetical protein